MGKVSKGVISRIVLRRIVGGAVLACSLAVASSAAPASAAPIASSPPAPSLPAFSGQTASPVPVKGVAKPPQNPFLATGPWSNIHNDTWMTDAYPGGGPIGFNLQATSGAAQPGVCGTIAFDSRGRIVTVCASNIAPPQVRLVDPETLAVLATLDLPNAPPIGDTPTFQDYTSGGYFFLDNRDRIWVSTKTNHVLVIGQTEAGDGFEIVRDFDLSGVLDPTEERISSVLPDFGGRLWFVSKQSGTVGTIDRKTKVIRKLRLGERVQNSFTVGKDGIYLASSRKMYRLGTTRNGTPKVVWKVRYRNTGQTKPGQADAGTGTTPTILKGGLVAITDNADPMNVVVYRTAARLKRGKKRTVCEVPVFPKGKGATENSLIGAARSLIVENNYGYTDPFAPGADQVVTEAGFARVDVRADGRGCRKVWTNRTERAPSVVPKMSTRTGLIYTYTRPPDPSGSQGYYWTAINFRNGKTVWSRYAGSGFFFNNNYAGLALGPDGSAYLGVIGGIIRLSDSPLPD
jgi:hypothetical protein